MAQLALGFIMVWKWIPNSFIEILLLFFVGCREIGRWILGVYIITCKGIGIGDVLVSRIIGA